MVKISEKHGLNPSLMLCYYCQEPSGVAVMGRLKGDAEAPRQATFDMEPCAKCKEFMKMGVICISVRDGETDALNPYRTGNWCVIRAEALIPHIKPPELKADIEKRRVCFIMDSDWQQLGFPHAGKRT